MPSKNPPTLWSGVLDHSNRGEVSSPLPPSALGALPGHFQNLHPFDPNGPSIDPFEPNGSYNIKSPAAGGSVYFSIILVSLEKLLPV